MLEHEFVQESYTTADDKPLLLIVTGYSGAGKSTVLRTLEDCGFFTIDNLPLDLFEGLLRLVRQSPGSLKRVALGIDVRGGESLDAWIANLRSLAEQQGIELRIIFLRASEPVLFKRFQETRRKHPLADPGSLHDAVTKEKELLQPFADAAAEIIDTDSYTIHQLRRYIRHMVDKRPVIAVHLMSFGFKYGVPLESNFVFDVRFLPNPYFVPDLKEKSGKDELVKEYLFSHAQVTDYIQQMEQFLAFCLEQAYKEGRFYLTVAIGCTGGRHRSVALAENLARQNMNNVEWILRHRDITRTDD